MPESAAAAKTATAEARPYVCDECGQQFTRQQGLTRHKRETHGAEAKVKSETKDATSVRLQTRLAEFAAPLLEERAQIQAELDHALVVANDLKQEVRSYDAALKRIDPSLVRSKAPAGQGKSNERPFDPAANQEDANKIGRVEEYLTAHDEYAQSFTINSLQERMQAVGSGISQHKMRKIIEVMHERGIVRKDKIVKGGGWSYTLIGKNGHGEA